MTRGRRIMSRWQSGALCAVYAAAVGAIGGAFGGLVLAPFWLLGVKLGSDFFVIGVGAAVFGPYLLGKAIESGAFNFK